MPAQYVSPNAAAKITGISRSAIMRAIEAKTLVARRDNKNRWLIAHPDLEAWAANRPDQDRSGLDTVRSVPDPDPIIMETLIQTRIDLAGARAEASGLRDRLADVQGERDRLAGLLERALERQPGILARIFRRR